MPASVKVCGCGVYFSRIENLENCNGKLTDRQSIERSSNIPLFGLMDGPTDEPHGHFPSHSQSRIRHGQTPTCLKKWGIELVPQAGPLDNPCPGPVFSKYPSWQVLSPTPGRSPVSCQFNLVEATVKHKYSTTVTTSYYSYYKLLQLLQLLQATTVTTSYYSYYKLLQLLQLLQATTVTTSYYSYYSYCSTSCSSTTVKHKKQLRFLSQQDPTSRLFRTLSGNSTFCLTLHVVLLSYYLWPYADCTLRTRSFTTLQSDYRWCYCPTTSGPTLTVPYGRAPSLPYSLTTGGVTVLLPLALR